MSKSKITNKSKPRNNILFTQDEIDFIGYAIGLEMLNLKDYIKNGKLGVYDSEEILNNVMSKCKALLNKIKSR